MLSKLEVEKFAILRHEKFEEAVVKELLGHYELEDQKWNFLVHSNYSLAGKYLSLTAFCDFFPGFPIWLQADSECVTLADWTPAKLFKGFEKLPLVVKYRNARYDLSSDVPLGLVFPLPYQGRFIIHDLPLADVKGVQLRSTTAHGKYLAVQPFGDFLRAVDRTHESQTWRG